MRFLLTLLLILSISSCQKEAKAPASTSDGISGAATQVTKGSGQDFAFDSNKEKDESCDTEEDLEKQIEKAKKKQEAFKLQGNDGGCAVE